MQVRHGGLNGQKINSVVYSILVHSDVHNASMALVDEYWTKEDGLPSWSAKRETDAGAEMT